MAGNNADWCDLMCRSHGVATQRDQRAWTSRSRSPRFYPDAVTLVADQSVDELLSRVDDSPGCRVKDSFASLDLSAHGFRADLLDHDVVTVIAGRADGDLVAGAVLNASGGVVGISNVFARSLYPNARFCGYESGDDLADALRHGFEPVGPLRVWIRDD